MQLRENNGMKIAQNYFFSATATMKILISMFTVTRKIN